MADWTANSDFGALGARQEPVLRSVREAVIPRSDGPRAERHDDVQPPRRDAPPRAASAALAEYNAAQDGPLAKARVAVWAAGGIVSLALIAGVGVWGYKLVLREVMGLPIVVAAEGPMRIAPANPGGENVPQQGLAVNAIPAAGLAAAPSDVLMLAPPTPGLAEEDLEVVQTRAEEGEVLAAAAAVPPADLDALPPAEAATAVEASVAPAEPPATPGPVESVTAEPAPTAEAMVATLASTPLPSADRPMTTAEVLAFADQIATASTPLALPSMAATAAPEAAPVEAAATIAPVAASPVADAVAAVLPPEPAPAAAAAPLIPASVPGVAAAIRPAVRPAAAPVAAPTAAPVAAAEAAPAEAAPADIAPADIAPADIATADIAPAPAEAAPVEAPATPANPALTASLPAGTHLIQLGAFDSPEIAASEWSRLQGSFGEFLGGKERVIQETQSSGRTLYRLRAMGFPDRADARRLCAALTAEGADCIPVTVD